MALLNKLFRKKDRFEDLEKELEPPKKRSFPFDEQGPSEFSSGLGVGRTRFGGEDLGPSPLTHPFRESPLAPPPSLRDRDIELVLKNLELLSSKIDSLKAAMESMNQRVQTIERIALREQER